MPERNLDETLTIPSRTPLFSGLGRAELGSRVTHPNFLDHLKKYPEIAVRRNQIPAQRLRRVADRRGE